jgi:hypothetical protein
VQRTNHPANPAGVRATEALQREERSLQELTGLREETRRREEQHTQDLAAAREEARQREAAARRREETLLERLSALQEELAKPWWKRLWPQKGR